MVKFFFDIETLPCEDTKKEDFLKILKIKHEKSQRQEITEEELFLTTSLEGTFGRICCIGYIKENHMIEKNVLNGTEKEILTEFWQKVRDVNLFIGHNIYEFDLPFIYKRSIINGVKPRLDISFARYRNFPIYDTIKEWELWGFSHGQKLDTLAKALDLPTSKEEMDGSMVWPYYQEGKMEDICTYCMKDVELTRKVYYKMICETPPGEQTSFTDPF